MKKHLDMKFSESCNSIPEGIHQQTMIVIQQNSQQAPEKRGMNDCSMICSNLMNIPTERPNIAMQYQSNKSVSTRQSLSYQGQGSYSDIYQSSDAGRIQTTGPYNSYICPILSMVVPQFPQFPTINKQIYFNWNNSYTDLERQERFSGPPQMIGCGFGNQILAQEKVVLPHSNFSLSPSSGVCFLDVGRQDTYPTQMDEQSQVFLVGGQLGETKGVENNDMGNICILSRPSLQNKKEIQKKRPASFVNSNEQSPSKTSEKNQVYTQSPKYLQKISPPPTNQGGGIISNQLKRAKWVELVHSSSVTQRKVVGFWKGDQSIKEQTSADLKNCNNLCSIHVLQRRVELCPGSVGSGGVKNIIKSCSNECELTNNQSENNKIDKNPISKNQSGSSDKQKFPIKNVDSIPKVEKANKGKPIVQTTSLEEAKTILVEFWRKHQEIVYSYIDEQLSKKTYENDAIYNNSVSLQNIEQFTIARQYIRKSPQVCKLLPQVPYYRDEMRVNRNVMICGDASLEQEQIDSQNEKNMDEAFDIKQRRRGTQKTSRFQNLTKLLMYKIIKIIGSTNLSFLKIEEKILEILPRITNRLKQIVRDKKKQSDFINHSHYRALFLRLTENSIKKILRKQDKEKDIVNHLQLYSLDLKNYNELELSYCNIIKRIMHKVFELYCCDLSPNSMACFHQDRSDYLKLAKWGISQMSSGQVIHNFDHQQEKPSE